MDYYILGLCGLAGSGKDEVAKALFEDGWIRVAFADAVREGLLGINPNVDISPLRPWWRRWRRHITPLQDAVAEFGWDRLKQLPEVRGLLQRYGTEGGRDIHGRCCWVEVLKRKIQTILDTWHGRNIAKFVVTDARFPEESAFIRDQQGSLLRVERLVGRVKLQCGTGSHASERSLVDGDWDLVLFNDNTRKALHNAARTMVRQLMEVKGVK